MTLEDKDGRPWTASMHLAWIVLIVALTSGMAGLALALYLAFWIRWKSRSPLSLYGFVFVLVSLCLTYPLNHFHLYSERDWLDALSAIGWVASTYALRREIKTYYRNTEGWEPTIGPVFTFFFTVVYINYCLNPVTFYHANPTSLNLSGSEPVLHLRK